MKRLCVCAALLLAAIPASAAKGARPSVNSKSLGLIGRPAPEFTLADLEEHPFALTATNGHIVLLSFWASWCGPCRAELATLSRLQKELAADSVDVVLIALDDPAKANRFLKKARLDAHSLVDERSAVGKMYGVQSIPRAFVIDRDGMVRRVLFGRSTEESLRKAIDAARQ